MTIKEKFQQLKKEGRKAFIAYVPFGFPSIKQTKNILLILQEAGVDIIEVGIPFSDPIADGPIIHEAATMALRKGATTEKLFCTLKELKNRIKVPLILMSYYNPVFKFGVDRFFKKMKDSGLCGILTVDLPIDESSEYLKKAKKFGLETILFVTPVTPKARAQRIVRASSGFIYYISVTGITGPRDISYASLAKHIQELKTLTNLPICVGFGIHTKEQVEKVWRFSDGAIMGSAVVKFIKDNYPKRNFSLRFKKYLRSLCMK